MDEGWLIACARYVELNPVRARLVERPEQWRWSSARTHLGLGDDGVTDAAPLLDRMADWRGLLDGGLAEDQRDAIRARERTGHALGSERFIKQLGAVVGRDVSPRPRGRPRKASSE